MKGMESVYKWLVKLRNRTQLRYILALNKAIILKTEQLIRLKTKLKNALKEEMEQKRKERKRGCSETALIGRNGNI